MRTLILMTLALALSGTLHAAESSLQVIDMHYRNAQEMLPLLQPLVAPLGSVSALDNKLVIRATAEQMTEVRRVLDALDQPPRQLLISVRQSGAGDHQRQSVGLSGSYRRDVGSIVVPRENGSVAAGAELRLRNDQSSSQSDGSQQLRTEEGREAHIFLGQSLPYSSRFRTLQGDKVERTEYHDAGSGFTVLPRIQGQQVQLEISLKQQVPGPGGSFNIQHSSSTVNGPLGAWFEIGGAVQQLTQSSNSLLGSQNEASNDAHSIMVRVEEIH